MGGRSGPSGSAITNMILNSELSCRRLDMYVWPAVMGHSISENGRVHHIQEHIPGYTIAPFERTDFEWKRGDSEPISTKAHRHLCSDRPSQWPAIASSCARGHQGGVFGSKGTMH